MINIGYFSNQFAAYRGHGITRYAHNLFNALSNKKNLSIYPISASTNGTGEEINALKSKTGLQVLPWGRRITPLSWILLHFPYLEMGVNCQIDIVHAVSLGYKVATKKPYIVTIHDIGPLTHPDFFSKKDQWFMSGSLKQAVKKAASIICVSQATADAVEAYSISNYNISLKKRIYVIHEGVHETFFKAPNVNDISDIKIVESLINKPFILTVGQISPRKNIQTVLKSFSMLKDSIPELQIITVGGNGWDYQKIKEQVDKLGLKNRVHFLGYVSDKLLKHLYRKAVVFVYPSLFEGFGLTILEAMASGCPVITSNTTSLPEVAGNAAVLVSPKDELLLSNSIRNLYYNIEEREKMIKKGILRARDFTWKKAAELTYKVYLDTIKN